MPMARNTVLALALCLSAAFAEKGVAAAPPGLTLDLSFRCVWWSPAEIAAMIPSDPPMQSTEIKMEQWDNSDSIRTPNPDLFSVVVCVRNAGTRPVADFVVTVSGQWCTGPVANKTACSWTSHQTYKISSPLTVAPGDSLLFRVPVDLSARFVQLKSRGLWPWTFRTLVTARSAFSRLDWIKAQADLPILRGR